LVGWDLRGKAWEDPHIKKDLDWMWKEQTHQA
jgi:hypothetical protein